MNKIKSLLYVIFGIACLVSVYILRMTPEYVKEEYRGFNNIILIVVVLYLLYKFYIFINSKDDE